MSLNPALFRSINPTLPHVMLEAVRLMAAVCLIPPDGHEKVTINNKQHVEKQAKVRGKYFWQGCGSAFNFCGSRSGSSCFFNADPDPALKNV